MIMVVMIIRMIAMMLMMTMVVLTMVMMMLKKWSVSNGIIRGCTHTNFTLHSLL